MKRLTVFVLTMLMSSSVFAGNGLPIEEMYTVTKVAEKIEISSRKIDHGVVYLKGLNIRYWNYLHGEGQDFLVVEKPVVIMNEADYVGESICRDRGYGSLVKVARYGRLTTYPQIQPILRPNLTVESMSLESMKKDGLCEGREYACASEISEVVCKLNDSVVNAQPLEVIELNQ